MPRSRRGLRSVFLAAAILVGAASAPAQQRPNVVIVIMDDVGFADLGAYGSEIGTPNIDRLAANGLRYTRFTVNSVCSPTRASLLTGLNHHSAGVGHASDVRRDAPGYRGTIHRNVALLPEVLREHGYSTLMVGKWHLVNASDRSEAGPFDEWPTGRGFERFWGFLASHTSQWIPHDLWDDTRRVEVPIDGSFYLPDALTDQAIALLEAQRRSTPERPFLLYYASGTAHAPHHTRPEDRAKYAGRYARGYDAVRAERLERQKQLGLLPADTQLAPYYAGVVPWTQLSAEERRVSARLQENYAAFLDNLDQNVGRLVAWLERAGALENTILLVMSDNGASREAFTNGTTNQSRWFLQSGETHAQRMRELPGVGGPDGSPNYPHGWMQASNTPFKLCKSSVHGGGVRSPLIVHWPAALEDRGGLRPQFHHVNDVMPTLLELLEIPHPAARPGSALKPMEGVSFAYSLRAASAPTRKLEQYYEMEGNRAWYERGWKLVSWHPDGEPYADFPWELYDLDADPAELHDRAPEMPEKVAAMAAAFDAAARRYDVLPLNDRFIGERGSLPPDPPRRVDYAQGAGPIPAFRAPRLLRRPYSLIAEVQRAPGQDGVLAAHGDMQSGYSFYVQDDRLHFEVNWAGEFARIRADEPLPGGALELRVDFEPDGLLGAVLRGGLSDHYRFLGGAVTLRVDDRRVGRGRLPRGTPPIVWEGLDVGLDRGSPVTRAYAPPFAFEGELRRLSFDLR